MKIPSGIERKHALEAISLLSSGAEHGFGESTTYDLVFEEQRYPPKAVVGLAYEISTGKKLGPKDFSGGEEAGQANAYLRGLGFNIVEKVPRRDGQPEWTASTEGHRRWNAWVSLGSPEFGDPVTPSALRKSGLYGGAQGIFVGRSLTVSAEYSEGLAISILHTGTVYPDELGEEGVIYHYPETRRPGGRDTSEIRAVKDTQVEGIPVLLIVRPSPSSSVRHVRWAYLVDFDDDAKQFFLSFDGPAPAEATKSEPFNPTAARNARKRLATTRPGQAKFRFQVLKRYGPRCAVCELSIPELLEAAHLVAKQFDGCDDPRNGLVLCRNHHRALDRGFFKIEPQTTQLEPVSPGTLEQLAISRTSLKHLPYQPASEALDVLFDSSE